MNYCAIDFETATASRDSACSVAVVEVRDGQLADEHYILLQPPGNRYDWRNVRIHGIRPEDTAHAYTFVQLWPKLGRMLQENQLVLAHNAAFDMSVIKGCLRSFGLPPVQFQQCCTVKMSKFAWPDLDNHRLDTVARYMGVEFRHHDALEDARVCAMIPLYAARELGVKTFQELKDRLCFPVVDFWR